MVFSSMIFLCVFLPVTLLVHAAVRNNKVRNFFLILMSLLFYAYGESTRVLLMLLCAAWNWLMAVILSKTASRKLRKAWFLLAFVLDLALLGVYKYAGFFVSTVNSVLGTAFPVSEIALPIGISFFTFQAMGYVADVYRGKIKGSRNFFNVLLYISFFPQLIAGPIVKYRDIADEIEHRKIGFGDTAKGLRRFIVGLSKKVLIANTVAALADYIYSLPSADLSLPAAWLGAVAYMMQIYFDFSGYSDMAIGLGRMFGFHFRENFNYPYAATSMIDFWRRWHISLTDWFRENLYFPLGGNRKGRVRTWINRIIVFFFTGLWHGASWTFVLWGLFHGAFTVLETAFPKLTKRLGWFRHVYVWLVVMIGFVLFRAESLGQAGVMIRSMFLPATLTLERLAALSSALNPMYLAALVAGGIVSLPIIPNLRTTADGSSLRRLWHDLSYAVSGGLLLLCMISLSGGAYNPFIYFRF